MISVSELPITVEEGLEIEFPNFGRLTVGEFFNNGTNAKVHHCASNTDYVIKVHRPRPLIDSKYDDSYTIEHKMNILSPSLCTVLDHTFVDLANNRFCIVMLMRSFTDYVMLQEVIRDITLINKSNIIPVMASITNAYVDLQNKGWLHGDVSERNILIHPKTLEIQLIDFEWAERVSIEGESYDKDIVIQGTPELMSPEVRFGYSKSLDSEFWGLCVMLMKLIEPSVASQIRDVDNFGMLDWIKNNDKNEPLYRFNSSNNLPHAICDIIEKGTTPNPEQRPTISDLSELLNTDSNDKIFSLKIKYPESYIIKSPETNSMGVAVEFDNSEIIRCRKGRVSNNMQCENLRLHVDWQTSKQCFLVIDYEGGVERLPLVENMTLECNTVQLSTQEINFL